VVRVFGYWEETRCKRAMRMSVRTAKPCLKPAFLITLKKKSVKQPTPLQKKEGLVFVFGFSGVV
jgi:hypothetical protein